MNNSDKRTLKKSIRKLTALPVLRGIKPLTDSYLRINGLKEEAERLHGSDKSVVLFGINRLSIKFYRMLKDNGVRVYLIAVDDEAVPAELACDVIQSADLIYIKEQQPLFYSMTGSMDGVVKSRLLDLGFRPQSVKRLGFGTQARIRGCRLADSWDPLLGSVRTRDSELPGYTVFGSDNTYSGLRIMILGGSTSDPTLMNIKSWSEYLFEALKSMGISAHIYNGAVGGYTSSQELKKLVRDISIVRPQLIISLSGVNDAAGIYIEPKHPMYLREDRAAAEWLVKAGKAVNGLQDGIPLKNTDFGPEDKRSLFNIWLDNQRCMHAVSNEFGAEFYSYLQPIKEINAVKTDFYRDARSYFARSHPDWQRDISRIFDEDKGVFADFCHVYEKGNRKLSKIMLRCVLDYLDTHKL